MKDKTGDANNGDNNNMYRKLDKLQVTNTLILAIATLAITWCSYQGASGLYFYIK
jgi:hypothetical protein